VFSNTDLLIQDEIQKIDDLFDKYMVLFESVRQNEPDSVDALALAAHKLSIFRYVSHSRLRHS
jgi:hypothetical protein